MKNNTKIILIHLLLQGGIGALFIIPTLLDAGAMLTGGLIGGLIFVAILSIFLSQVILSFFTKFPKEQNRRGLKWGLLTWFVFLPVIIVVFELASEKFQLYQKHAAAKSKGLNLSKQIGLANFTWDSDLNAFRYSNEHNIEQIVYVNDRTINVTANVNLPAFTDTLGWLKAALHQVEPYLNASAFNELDSCILNKNYRMESVRDFAIFSKSKGHADIWIESSSCRIKSNFQEYLCLTLPISTLTLKTVDKVN